MANLGFFYKADKEVYHYAGEKIVIQGSIDSYGGLIWPAAVSLCHYLDTHREEVNLVDKAVLEIGAGTGLLSVVASILGAWVTATDLPDILSNLRLNLSRNTRGRCKHTPQVAALSWGHDLEQTYPTSVYRYDYVLAADVVYHHDFLDELLETMKHFCQPGTTLIWANKVRFGSDLSFTDNFKRAFNTRVLAEDGEIKIFMATCKESSEDGDAPKAIQDQLGPRVEEEEEETENNGGNVDREDVMTKLSNVSESEVDNVLEEEVHMDTKTVGHDDAEESEVKQNQQITTLEDDEVEEDDIESNDSSSCNRADLEEGAKLLSEQTTEQQQKKSSWTPSLYYRNSKDVYHYVGHDICIYESIDSYGAVMWPAALTLCSHLEDNRDKVNLQDRTVLELGAGTGLVTIVASLLGAAVTATDLPAVQGNLIANVMRNTRGRCKHMPKVNALSWGYDLELTHPSKLHHYDYVLATDVVYHHDYLGELLATMKHFCQPGTTLIWANKFRFKDDWTFAENFKKAFHTTLMFEDNDMKILMATCRE